MKRFFLCSALVLSVGMSTSSVKANAHDNEMETTQYSPHLENFDGKPEEAKKWHEEKFKKFENKLQQVEKTLIERIEKPKLGNQKDLFSKPDLNALFRLTNGDPKALPDTIKYRSMKREIVDTDKLMKKLFSAKAYTLEQDMVVHQQFSWRQYQLLEDDKSIKDGKTGEFTPELKHVIEDNLDWGVHNYYAVYELTPPKDVEEEIIKIELTLPKHTKVLLQKDGKIILDRGQGYKVRGSAKIVKQQGKRVFSVKADLISEKELKNEKKILDQKIKQKLEELPFFKDFSIMYPIKTELIGEFASVMIEPIVDLIEDLTQTYPPELNKKLIELMVKKNKSITFVDRIPLFSEDLKDISRKIFKDNDKGFERMVKADAITYDENMIFNTGIKFISDKKANSDLLRHEMGHVIDYFVAELKKDNKAQHSETSEFQQLYLKEKDMFTEPGKENEREFWAEIVRHLYSPSQYKRDLVMRSCPESSKYIVEKINELVNSK